MKDPLLVQVAGSATVRALLDGGGISGAGETEKKYSIKCQCWSEFIK